jgi:hypothetical protein
LSVISLMRSCISVSPQVLTQCIGSAKRWFRCSAKNTWDNQMFLTILGYCRLLSQGGFKRYFEAGIACIRSERTFFSWQGNIKDSWWVHNHISGYCFTRFLDLSYIFRISGCHNDIDMMFLMFPSLRKTIVWPFGINDIWKSPNHLGKWRWNLC